MACGKLIVSALHCFYWYYCVPCFVNLSTCRWEVGCARPINNIGSPSMNTCHWKDNKLNFYYNENTLCDTDVEKWYILNIKSLTEWWVRFNNKTCHALGRMSIKRSTHSWNFNDFVIVCNGTSWYKLMSKGRWPNDVNASSAKHVMTWREWP